MPHVVERQAVLAHERLEPRVGDRLDAQIEREDRADVRMDHEPGQRAQHLAGVVRLAGPAALGVGDGDDAVDARVPPGQRLQPRRELARDARRARRRAEDDDGVARADAAAAGRAGSRGTCAAGRRGRPAGRAGRSPDPARTAPGSPRSSAPTAAARPAGGRRGPAGSIRCRRSRRARSGPARDRTAAPTRAAPRRARSAAPPGGGLRARTRPACGPRHRSRCGCRHRGGGWRWRRCRPARAGGRRRTGQRRRHSPFLAAAPSAPPQGGAWSVRLLYRRR